MLRSIATSGTSSRPLKRRRVRRGTQSCWECKRRKVRCSFIGPDESVCDGCRSRGVSCTSQKFYEEEMDAAVAITVTTGHAILPSLKPQTTTVTPSSPKDAPNAPRHVADQDRHAGLCRTLVGAWPTRPDLDLILSVPIGTSVLFHGVVCKPYSDLLANMPSAREILQLTPHDSHPVLITRKLLLLATLLQGIPRGSVKHLGPLGTGYVDTMSRLVETAKLVTGNDDIVNSLEGIECIMIESMYYNNAGNIRRAWVTHRRAMIIAQVMGLHRLPSTSGHLKVLHSDTRHRVNPEHMWYRLVITDRYLSLVLGLPQCSSGTSVLSGGGLHSSTPLERMEHMESMAGGLILQRNESGTHDLQKTQEIDRLLQEAASLMAPQWWLPPNVATLMGTGSDAASETLRLMNQFTHYHLLAQLHLPYLLQPPTNGQTYDYSKITAITASREIVSRFVAFRSSDMVAAYCRGIDFLAFIASTLLALAHIDNHRRHRLGTGTERAETALGFLVHQRPSDRGLLEQTLQCMDDMSEGKPEKDPLSYKISLVLGELLAIEAAAADGAVCSTVVSSELGEPEKPGLVEAGRDGTEIVSRDASRPLQIHISSFGTVRIVLDLTGDATQGLLQLSPSPAAHRSDCLSPDHHTDSRDHGNMLEDTETSPVENRSTDASRPSVPSFLDSADDTSHEGVFHFFDWGHYDDGTPSFMLPGMASEPDDWGLQGVDLALFENLIKGSELPGPI